MPEHDRVLAVVREWVGKAENDLKNAAYTLQMDKECPTDTVCFHAQQCVEKYLKALLVLKGIDFPKTHDVSRVIALLPSRLSVDLTPEEQGRLTSYATVTRYPGDYEPISIAEARKAVRIARRVRKEIRAYLPKEALRRKRK
jgi:HEPN domain-containing protein